MANNPGTSTENPVPSSQPPNSDDAVAEAAHRLQRFLVLNSGHRSFLTRSDLQKVVQNATRNIQPAVDRAAARVRDVYGFNLLTCNQPTNKSYVLSNALPYMDYEKEPTEGLGERDAVGILTLLVLSHIFMSDGPVSEESVYEFLKGLHIDPERRHPVFGKVKEHISTLVKQKLLQSETDPVSKKTTFAWGVRAETEISKMEVLKFVCEIYKDYQPKTWTSQYKAAMEQGFANVRLEDEEFD